MFVTVDDAVCGVLRTRRRVDDGATRGAVMAIAVELTYRGPGATAEGYNKVLSDAGITPGGSHPDPECLFHWGRRGLEVDGHGPRVYPPACGDVRWSADITDTRV